MYKMSPPEESEYGRLYGDYWLAINDSYKKLIWYGVNSKEFQEANANANTLLDLMGRVHISADDSHSHDGVFS